MRLFVGTLLSASTQSLYASFLEELVTRHRQELRAVPRGSAHLTYAFCAEADERAVAAILGVLQQTAGAHRAFEISLGPPHLVPATGRPRLVCADIASGGAEVQRLTSDLLASLHLACPDLPLSPSRTPHVTLARFRKQARRPDAEAVARSLASWPHGSVDARDQVAQLQLVASTLTSSGPLYQVQAGFPLANAQG